MQGKPPKVTPLRLTAGAARKRIAELALVTSNIRWTDHVRERMKERGFDSEGVLRILRTGSVDEPPELGKSDNEWKVKVTKRMPSGRAAGVVALIISDAILRLLTVEWEDLS
jgi:hypothetical protein